MTNPKINILMVAEGLGIGGAEAVIQHLVTALDRERFTVAIACLKGAGMIGNQLLRDGVDLVALAEPGATKVDYLSFIKLRRLIRERNIHVVHTHTTDALADAAVCRLLNPRLRVLHTFHFGNYPYVNRKKWLLEVVFSRLANRLVAVGEVQRQQIIRTFYFRDRSIGRVWNGVPSNRLRSNVAFRRSIGGEGKLLIATIATLIPQKGLEDLLSVAQRVKAVNDRVLFVVVGEGSLRSSLTAQRHNMGLDDVVLFPGWIKDAAQVVLPECDVYFQPSRWEAMSIAILEAMAAQRAIVATRVGENPHVLTDGVTALLTERGDIAGMTATLNMLLADAALRRCLGIAAASVASSTFSVDMMARAYEKIYEDLV